jgi:hypothetical protein
MDIDRARHDVAWKRSEFVASAHPPSDASRSR